MADDDFKFDDGGIEDDAESSLDDFFQPADAGEEPSIDDFFSEPAPGAKPGPGLTGDPGLEGTDDVPGVETDQKKKPAKPALPSGDDDVLAAPLEPGPLGPADGEEEGQEPPGPPKKKGSAATILVIAGMVILVLILGVFGGYLVVTKFFSPEDPADRPIAKTDKAKPEPAKPKPKAGHVKKTDTPKGPEAAATDAAKTDEVPDKKTDTPKADDPKADASVKTDPAKAAADTGKPPKDVPADKPADKDKPVDKPADKPKDKPKDAPDPGLTAAVEPKTPPRPDPVPAARKPSHRAVASDGGPYSVQVGSYYMEASKRGPLDRLSELGYTDYAFSPERRRLKLFHVIVGQGLSGSELQDLKARVAAEGYAAETYGGGVKAYSYGSQAVARQTQRKLIAAGFKSVRVQAEVQTVTLDRLRVGRYSKARADQAIRDLRRSGFKEAYVVRN